MRTIVLLFLSIVISMRGYSQDILSSSVYVETCIENKECVTVNNSGILFYDETKTALYLKVDFNKEGDSVVEWLKDLPESILYFKVVVPPDFFKNTSNYNQKTIPLVGQIFFNGFWKPQTVDIGLRASENSNITINTDNPQYENFKVNFSLAVLPEEFRIYEKLPYLKETISVGLSSGRVNQLKPGMEGILSDVYNHN